MSGAALLALLLLACASAPRSVVPAALSRYSAPGSHQFAINDLAWLDEERHLTMHARVYYPTDQGRHPLIIFSHGLGNSRFGYRYLGEHWASWGFVSVHLEHPGAGQDLSHRGLLAIYRAGFDHDLWVSTPADVHQALDFLLSADAPPLIRDRIDTRAIGVAGHSLGAFVALATAGAIRTLDQLPAPKLADGRVRAAIALSMSENLNFADYGSTEVPILHMTGSRDSSLLYGTTQRMRRIPFDSIKGSTQMLITIRGANHSTFSADDRSARRERIELIKAATTLWWRAWLENDAESRRTLFAPTMSSQVAPIAAIETRNVR